MGKKKDLLGIYLTENFDLIFVDFCYKAKTIISLFSPIYLNDSKICKDQLNQFS